MVMMMIMTMINDGDDDENKFGGDGDDDGKLYFSNLKDLKGIIWDISPKRFFLFVET